MWALTANTNEEAKYLFASRAAWKIGRNYGQLGSITDPDNALSIINDNGWTEQYQNMYQNSLVGDANITKNKISNLVEENNIDEIAILTWCHNENHRIKSYEIFANAFELSEKREPEKSTI